jgi:dienelactone hydrolase
MHAKLPRMYPRISKKRAAAVLSILMLSAAFQSGYAANPIDSGYGADGPYSVHRDSIESAAMKRAFIHLFRPAQSDTDWPVIFFIHGIGGHDPAHYLELLEHIASRGYAVVYAPYAAATAMTRPQTAYAMMRKGFEQGVRAWRPVLDSTRMGVIGHSYGGGAAPALSYRWLVKRAWGGRGAFLYIMAPWYSYDISPQQLESFTDSTSMIMQVYEDDHINDHRMAKDIFDNIGIASSKKNFILLHSDSAGGEAVYADHAAPAGSAGGGRIDYLDYYGVWRLVDALADFSLNGNERGRSVALGSGATAQRFMGVWPDGTPVRELTGAHTSFVLRPQNSYLNFWSHKFNPRFARTTFFNSLPFWREKRRMTIRNYVTLKPGADTDADRVLVPHSTGNLSFAPVDTGYGAPGPHTVRTRDFPHPSLGHGRIYIFSPQQIDSALPVIVFIHGFQWPMPDFYRGLITSIAGRGYHVVFPSYMLYRTTLNNKKRYDLILKGSEEAFLMLGEAADTSRLGFIGHSYGGAAVPAVAWHYLKLKEWGKDGAFMFIIAPWYVYNFSPHQFEYFPSHARLLVQVYEGERFNDWRMAEDLFYSFSTIPFKNKDFMIVHNDHYKGKLLEAEHVSPLSGNKEQIDPIDFYALYRMAQALAAASFDGDTAAHTIALGNGSQQQIYMGVWPDKTPITPLTVTDRPVTPYHQKSYLFDWNRPWNRRRRHYRPVEKAKPKWLYRIQSRK